MTVPSSIVFFPVANIGYTNTFYEQIIGLRLVQVQKSSTSECHIYDTGYGYIGFCQYNDGRTIPSGKQGMCISFNCKDKNEVEAKYQQLKDQGIPVVQPPKQHDHFDVYSCFFADPDGYNVEFQYIDGFDQ